MNKTSHDFPPIWLIILMFIWVWPVALVLLLYKIGLFDGIIRSVNQSGTGNGSAEDTRMKQYKIMTAGAKTASIPHLASAVGVSYEVCLRELQKMVSTGQFGATAYINYADRTLVLVSETAGARTATEATPNYAAKFSGGQYGSQSKVDTRYSSGRPTQNQTQQYSRQFSEQYAQQQAERQKQYAQQQAERQKQYAQQQAERQKQYAQQQAQQQAQQPKKTSRTDSVLKQLFGSAPGLLVGVSVVLFAMGAVLGISVVDDLSYGIFDWSMIITTVSMLLGGAATVISNIGLRRRAKRAAAYLTIINGRDYISIRDLVTTSGEKEKTVRRDLEVMIEKGLLGENAYIDNGAGLLILKADAAPAKQAEPEPEVADDEARYRKILKEIRQVNEDIPDPEISARIDEMEDLTAKIFKAVQDKPEKLPQIKSFMSYYLPTALKLLHSYAEFDQNGASGENVTAAKQDIERILDMLVEGFRKQLDKLYETDAMDVSADINVLETMLKKDGLSDDGSGFQVMGGH